MKIESTLWTKIQSDGIGRLVNVGLRGATLTSKFLLVLFLAKFLEPDDLGLFGLMMVSVAYALYLVGLDFYTYTTREIVKRKRSNEWGWVLKNQIVLSVILYFLFIPFFCCIVYFEIIPSRIVVWFFLLLVLEHFVQEVNRILVALSHPLMASVILFLRSGVWAIVAVFWMFFDENKRNLEFVLSCWVVGTLLGCLISFVYLKNLRSRGWKEKISWGWIWTGILVAIPFLISTLAIRGVLTVDKYWVEYISGLEVLGAYVLFMGISNSLISFLDSGVFVYFYPALIESHNSGDKVKFRKSMKSLIKQCFFVSLIFVVISSFVFPVLLGFLDKDIYFDNSWMFPWILLSTVIFGLGMVPQYGLYSQGKDRQIIISHIFGFLVFVAVLLFFPDGYRNFSVIFGLFLSFGLSSLWKFVAYRKLSPSEYLLKD